MSRKSVTCLKYMIFICNVPVMIVGAVAVGLSTWIVLDNPSFLALSTLDELTLMGHPYVLTGAYVIIAGGAAIFVLGVIGIIAACSQCACCLGLFAGLLSIIMCLETAGCTLGIVFKNTLEKHLDDTIYENIRDKYDGKLGSSDYFTSHMNSIQTTFSCCGFKNVSDFKLSTKWNSTLANGKSAAVPLPCCRPETNSSVPSSSGRMDCMETPTTTNSYTSSCKSFFDDIFRKYHTIIIASAGTLICCQLFMLVLSLIMLCYSLRNNDACYDFKD